MRHLNVLLLLGAMVVFTAQHAGAISVTGGDVATLTAAITQAQANYPSGDITVSIDDDLTYTLPTMTADYYQITKPIKIVAASGKHPRIYTADSSGNFMFRVEAPGFQLGSVDGGQITLDGGGYHTRFIIMNRTDSAAWTAPAGATTTKLENLVITGIGVWYRCDAYTIMVSGWTQATGMAANCTVNLTGVNVVFDDQRKSGGKNGVSTGSEIYGMNLNPENGSTINVTNCRVNGTMGSCAIVGSKVGNFASQTGTVNFTNCQFVSDAYTTSTYSTAPLLVEGWGTSNTGGYTVTMNNCFLRTDLTRSGRITGSWPYTDDTSNSLGCVSLLSYAKNDLTATNCAFVGTGACLNIDTLACKAVMTNCDLYVKNPTLYTPGYFVNLSQRVVAAGNNQTTMTRCNLYGEAGSNLLAFLKPAGSRFVMVNCNDWSPVNAYATGWITTGCQDPGLNPGYGLPAGGADVQPGIDARDFTVYNQTIKAANIGSNRAFNLGVPVEMSAFQIK
ncbi:hypothetical protein LLG95_10165 [bacterium]|nr:hypothetical protein [bacterium]